MPTTLQHKGVNSTAVPKRAVKLADEGIVRAIVAVTGVVDMVNDLIVPGAFKATLAVRRPKVVDDHEWQRKAGRVLHVEEWMPGDPRLPKRTKDGKPWPKEAGALVATMQYALSTTAGRESFEFVKFYAESNEAEFSIGYKVPDGKAIKRGDGVRVILQVNLFEFSHVLFGAAPLSMALEVKSMHAGTAGTATLPALGDTEETDGPDDDTPPPPLPADAVWDDDTETKQLYASPEVKTALGVVLEAKDGGWDRNAGNAENLRKWYVAGGDGQIPWGSPGDFAACVAIAGKHMSLEDAKGYCNLRHHEALGIYPATHAAMEGKDASEPIPTEVKAMSRMKGSYQERTQLVEVAARDLFEATYYDPCVCVVATYDTEAVVQLYLKDGTQPSYVVPYTLAPDGVALGTPEPVELSLVAEPKAGDDAPVPAADVEDVAVVAPVVAALEHAAALAATEGKAAAAVRAAIADLFATETKTAEDPEPADAEAPTITRETLPEGDWAKFRKTDPIEALRMDGPFTVETREGTLTCEDGWLAIDSDGYPYPIAAEEFDAVYAPAGDDQPAEPAEPAAPAEGDEGDEVAEKSAEGEAPGDPVDDVEPDGDPDDATDEGTDEGTVTLSPDDLYDPDAPEPQPSDEAIDAAIETEQEKSSQGDADTAPPETEDADPAPDEGGTESVTLDPDQHFKDLAELDDEAA